MSKAGKYGSARQYVLSLGLTSILVVVAYFSVDLIGYRVVALLLLLGVSISAMLFDIFPVLMSSVLSALSWNFFFIPPILTFHIGTPEDALMFLMYFVVALINAVLTYKIRQIEKKARDKEEREQTIHLYDTLLNSLSHELRTPIATIIGSIDTIRENPGKLTDGNRDELHREMEIAAFRLNRQVENLLSMSRLEADILQPRRDWCDVNELVYTVIKNNQGDIQDRKIEFTENDQLPLFKIDRALVEQVLHNIIHNALQHTPSRTTIRIRVENTTGCRISIEDNGPGFPEGTLNFVFNKFYRLPNSATGGTGLGLSIAKGFTEAHGGTIHVENIHDGGARFIIHLPAEVSYPTSPAS